MSSSSHEIKTKCPYCGKEFDITIPDEEAAKLVTVGDAVKYIDAHAKKAE